ncbi:MAG: TIGR02099 family protein, partial [Proteobacteria bacterium]|nr:TIGR02099 family protein [Pseudomonadota bacterium]
RFLQPGDERPRYFRVPRANVRLDERRVAVDAAIRLPGDLGRGIDVVATQLLDVPVEERIWDVIVEADDVLLAGWAELVPAAAGRLLAGSGDVDLSLALNGRGVRSAVAEFDLEDELLQSRDDFDVEGRLDFDVGDDGWLIAGDRFRIATSSHDWPESSWRAEAGIDPDGRIAVLDLVASYFNLDDLRLVAALLPDEQRARLADFAPSGAVRKLVATVSDLDADSPKFAVSAELDDFGFAAVGKTPGIRGFTGQLRADGSGGRLEIDSAGVLVDLPRFMDAAVDISTASGTVLWRASGDRITVLSDSIRLTNPALDTRINVELTLNPGGESPEIDFASTFRIDDVGEARRYIPRKLMKPKLYDWFQGALVSGSIERGTVRLVGPLDAFPFENGEGHLLVEGSGRNLHFKYQPHWPAAEQADIEVVLDNTRLYTVRNRSMNAGNLAVDADVEIADLRQPVLTIKGLVTGTLATLHRFALNSPIDRFTGGNLARIDAGGDASVRLDLTVPLKRARDTTINGLLRSNNGTVSVEGLDAPVTDLIGEVLITRQSITGDSIGGRFLGEEVNFRIGPGRDPRFFAVATATGTATATSLIEELGVPLEGLIEGAAAYEARILFPRRREESPVPFTVRIASPLRGMSVNLPEPVGKPANEPMFVRGDIRFVPGESRIESEGLADNGLAWQLAFARREDEVWDFDRGVVVSGGGAIEPAQTRGLHLRGRVDALRLDDWLSLSRGQSTAGAASRIRSADLVVDNLFAIGQHLQGHRVRVDRSALDWLVQLEGDDIAGSVFVPYDFGSERALVVDMERLRLPGDEVSPKTATRLDPRDLPPIKLTAGEFAIGDRYLGAIEADLARTGRGLESARLLAKDETFEVVATGRWVAAEGEPLDSRTYFAGTLNSTDVGATLSRLDFARGVTGETMGIVFDLSWDGGPRSQFADTLDGSLQLRLTSGQLEEVEPGAGRMLGLMSFAELPRRLSLDFSDVFNKGFRYSSIGGTFSIEDGVASTCDMSLEGPSAFIGMVGQVDIPGEQYGQGAVISAKVGNTLPIVGAVVGGPPAAAAMLIFSQIFKKPLEQVGQVFYSVSGPFREPAIESVSSDEFVRFGDLAGCLPAEQQQE